MMQALAFYLFSAVTVLSAIMVVTARNPVHSVLFLILAFFSAAGLFILLGAEFLAMILVVVYVGAVAVLFLFVVMMLDIPVPDTKAWFIPEAKALITASVKFFSYIFAFAFFAFAFYAAFYLFSLYVFDVYALLHRDDVATVAAVACYFAVGVLVSRQLASMLTGDKFGHLFTVFYRHLPVGWLIMGILLIELMLVINMWGSYPMSQELSTAPTPPSMVMSNTVALGNLIYTDYIYAFQISGMILLLAMIGAIVLTHRKREGVKRQNVSNQINRTKEESVELVKVKTGQGVQI